MAEMSEDDMMSKIVWDIPISPDSNKWSDDGMLAVLTANSIQVFTAKFDRDSYYQARWAQLEYFGESDASKKSPGPSKNDSYTVTDGGDLIHWLTEINRCEDRSFGKLDMNSIFYVKASWGPPGLGMGLPSYLSALLSNGSVLLLCMGGASHSNYLVRRNGKSTNVHLFSTFVALNLTPLFDSWMEEHDKKDLVKRSVKRKKSAAARSKRDSDSDEENSDDDQDSANPVSQNMVTDIASHPHLLSYNSERCRTRKECMLLATGSSFGHINIWAVQRCTNDSNTGLLRGTALGASCVCSVVLGESFSSKSDASLSITCMEFSTSDSDSNDMIGGDFKTTLLCGTQEGYLLVFLVTSMKSSSSTNSECWNKSNDDSPQLYMGQPPRVLRPFLSPINGIVMPCKTVNTVYLKSGIRLARVNYFTGRISPIEDIHSHEVCSVKGIESRGYSVEGDLLMTCSLDGDIKLWEQTVDQNGSNSIQANGREISSSSKGGKGDKRDKGKNVVSAITVIEMEEENVQSVISENGSLQFIQLFEGVRNERVRSILDLTFDPLQLVLSSSSLEPSSISDSREVQMNKNLERAHSHIHFSITPILNLKWILNLEKVIQVLKSVVFSSTSTSESGQFKPSKSDNASSMDVVDGGKDDRDLNHCYFPANDAEYLDVKSYSGLSFAWLKSFQEVVLDLARADPRTAAGILTLKQREECGISNVFKKAKSVKKGKRDKDSDEEDDDDTTPCRAGISDVAWRVKDLLYPNVHTVLDDTLDRSVRACADIAAECLSVRSLTGDPIRCAVGNLDPLLQEHLLSIPITDAHMLFYKMRLWRCLHQVLLSVPHTRGATINPRHASICVALRGCIQVGVAATSARKLLQRSRSIEGSRNGTFSLTSREVLSVQFIKQVLHEWDISMCDALGDLLSRQSGGSGQCEQTTASSSLSSSSTAANASASASSDVTASSSSSSNSSSTERSISVSEKCSVCGGSVAYKAPLDAYAAVSTSSCSECTTLFDRCCVTFVTVGFDSLISGNVLRCTICSSVGLLHLPEDLKRNSKHDAEESDTLDQGLGSNIEFEWCWWSGRGPSCPYCGVLMLPLI